MTTLPKHVLDKIERETKANGEWHGCATGDCPHQLYSECFDAAQVEGATPWAERCMKLREALELLKTEVNINGNESFAARTARKAIQAFDEEMEK